MDIDRLRYFLTVAQTGHIRQAADLHRISPPALSKAMKLLEDEVGMKLFLPSGRGIVLSEEGRQFAETLNPVLQQLGELLARRELSLPHRLRLASFEVFTTYFVELAAKKYFADFSIELHELLPGAMEAAVANRQVDLALTYLPIPHAGVEFLRVSTLEMGIYAKKGAFKKIEERVTPFAIPLAPVSGTPSRVRGLDGWPEDAFERNAKYRVTLLESALGLCRQGLGVVYIPKFIARIHNQLLRAEFHLEERAAPPRVSMAKTSVYLVKRKDDEEGVLSKKLAAALRGALQDG